MKTEAEAASKCASPVPFRVWPPCNMQLRRRYEEAARALKDKEKKGEAGLRVQSCYSFSVLFAEICC